MSSSARKRMASDPRVFSLEARVEYLRKRLDQRGDALSEMESLLTQLLDAYVKEVLKEISEEVKARIDKLEAATDKVRAEIAELRTEIAELLSNIDVVEAQLVEIAESKVAKQKTDANLDYFDIVRQLGPPSSLCKAENWRQAQEKLVYLCHIPQEAEPPFPLTLVHPAFANFVDRFNASKIEFGREDCEFVCKLCDFAVKEFKNEREKMDEFNVLLGKYLGRTPRKLGIQANITDGSLLSNERMVYLEEGKKAEGNPLFQAIHYYGLFLSDMERGERESTFCPCFLLELVGVHIRISGLAFFSKVACQPFTPFMHCYMNSYDKADMDSLCRAMLALKKGVFELIEYYSSSPPIVDKRIPYSLQEKQVQYIQRIGAKKLLFVVKMEQSGQLRLFKYCKRYGKAVHMTWAQGGLAPKLFESPEIKGAWIAVEMEYLSADDWKSVYQWCNDGSRIDTSGLMQAASEALHKALDLNCGDKKFAHGDMRSPNIMARSVEGRFEIKFVDFDWAGDVSATFYPSFINTEQKWHEDVGPGMPLSQHHDLWWADKWI